MPVPAIALHQTFSAAAAAVVPYPGLRPVIKASCGIITMQTLVWWWIDHCRRPLTVQATQNTSCQVATILQPDSWKPYCVLSRVDPTILAVNTSPYHLYTRWYRDTINPMRELSLVHPLNQRHTLLLFALRISLILPPNPLLRGVFS